MNGIIVDRRKITNDRIIFEEEKLFFDLVNWKPAVI